MKNLKKYEGFASEDAGDDNLSHEKNYMLISNLKKIKRMAAYILNQMNNVDDMDEWAKDHIATSADDIEEVYNFIVGQADDDEEMNDSTKQFEQFVSQKKDEKYIAHVDDKRKPGGSDKEIKNDYNLDVENRDIDGFDIVGTKQDVEAFLNDYGITKSTIRKKIRSL